MKGSAIAPFALIFVLTVLLLLRKFRQRLFPKTVRTPFAMTIDDVTPLSAPGKLIVSGVIFDGEVHSGDSLVVDTRYGRMPVRVEKIEIDRRGPGRSGTFANASQGDEVKITISGIHQDQVNIHDLLLDPKNPLKNARQPRSGAGGQFSDPSRPDYKPGQVYTYRTRPSEKKSLLTILKVELYGAGTVVHVHISGVSIQNSEAPDGVSTFISHMPFAQQAVDQSVTQLVDQKPQLPDYEEAYAKWKEQAERRKAGVFTLPVAQAIDGIEKAFQTGASPRRRL